MGANENNAFDWGDAGPGESEHQWFDRTKWLARKRARWPKPEPSDAALRARARRIEKGLGMRFLAFVERNPLTTLSGILTALLPFARVLFAKWGITFTDDAWFALASFLAGFGLISAKDAKGGPS
jgi:hypothetical protein